MRLTPSTPSRRRSALTGGVLFAALVVALMSTPASAAPTASRVIPIDRAPAVSAQHAAPQRARQTPTPAGACQTEHRHGTRACVRPTAAPAAGDTTATPATAATWCDAYDAGAWWEYRFEACIHNERFTYTLVDLKTGKVLGEATFEFSAEDEFSNTALSWAENASLTMVSGTGDVAGLAIQLTASCTGCTVVSGLTWGGPVVTGRTLTGSVGYRASVAAGSSTTADTSYIITATQPDTVPVQTGQLWGPPGIRCDAIVGTSKGCVISDYVPELDIPMSDPKVGQAAAGIAWAQQDLPDRWGTVDNPLHRLADPAAQEANRKKICGTFTRSTTYNPNDSCDEYAFAASRESGGQLGIPGSSCAEIYPFYDDGVESGNDPGWYVQVITSDGTERCSRAHVEQEINVAVGRRLSGFTAQQRLLDKDAYYLYATA